MTTDSSEPTSMADEVTKRVIAALKPEFGRTDERFDKVVGEIRAAKSDLGQQIDALAAQQAGTQRQIGGMSDQLAALTAVVNGQTAQFRGIAQRLDKIEDRLDRLEREPIR